MSSSISLTSVLDESCSHGRTSSAGAGDTDTCTDSTAGATPTNESGDRKICDSISTETRNVRMGSVMESESTLCTPGVAIPLLPVAELPAIGLADASTAQATSEHNTTTFASTKSGLNATRTARTDDVGQLDEENRDGACNTEAGLSLCPMFSPLG